MAEDEILLELVGTLTKFSVEGSGKSASGVDWTRYKYSIATRDGPRTLSGFIDPMKDKLLNKEVKIVYFEAPNPKNADYPYKNVKFMNENVSQEQVDEANKQYNVVPISKPVPNPASQTAYEKRMDELHFRKQDEILFGQTANLASEWALAHRGEKDGDKDRGTIDYWFDNLHAYLLHKRKEKIGY